MNLSIHLDVKRSWINWLHHFIQNNAQNAVLLGATILSWVSWFTYYAAGHNLAYNDAMSHLDIARRVTDNITPGLAQLGSVWLPLLHVLMLPTIWLDSFWQTGMSAGLISMVCYITTVLGVYKTTYKLTSNIWSGFLASSIIAFSTNFLYLQTTALTEPLFIALFTWTMYYLVKWQDEQKIGQLVGAALMVCLATLTRYDGWALFGMAGLGVFSSVFLAKWKWHKAEGAAILFGTLAVFGIVLWFAWNLTIFGDPLYFATGEFSAKSQQDLLAKADDLPTKGNWIVSAVTYFYAMVGNIGIVSLIVGSVGWLIYMIETKSMQKRIISTVFLAPLFFNVLALYLGHSVIHLPEIVGQSWFNVRYGLIVMPWIAVFVGYLLSHKNFVIRTSVPLLIGLQVFLFFSSDYIITLDDGLWGSSQKNVKTIGSWIHNEIDGSDKKILVSVASHDAILFSTGLPMKQFIHEGTGELWDSALENPTSYADYVVMRTNDNLDLVSKNVEESPNFFSNYSLVYDDEFADIYKKNETE